MNFVETNVKDCVVVHCDRHHDQRGFFQELFEKDKYAQGQIQKFSSWQQVNWSHSECNVLRGIHYAEYSKLVTCIVGKIWDVVVDLRPNSPSFLKWTAVDLSSDESKQMYVPPGCGHGFYAYDKSEVCYLQSGLFAKQSELTVRFDDTGLKVSWPGKDHIISERDKSALSLSEFLNQIKM